MNAATSTFDLMERAQRGEEQAFSLLFEKYRRRLAVLIHYRLGATLQRRIELEDLMQEVFLRAFRDLQRFEYRGSGSFLNWLSEIAGHAASDAARFYDRKKRAGREVPFRSASNPDGPEPRDSFTPSRRFEQREKLDRLLRLLDQLPPNYRSVILLARVEELSTAEVANRLQISRSAASLLLHRALKRLRELSRHSNS